MPNWCSTTYYIVGPDEELTALNKKLKQWAEDGKIPTDFGKSWLGNIADGIGEDWQTIRCRGVLTSAVLEKKGGDTVLHLETETAWSPANELWDKVIEKAAPHCGYYYFAEEPGMELYETNDLYGEFFPFDYVVDAYWEDHEHDDFREYFPDGSEEWDAKDLEPVLRSLLKDDKDSLSDLIGQVHDLQVNWDSEDMIHIYEVDKQAV